MADKLAYRYSREEIVQMVREELKLSKENYETAIALSTPNGKQNEMGIYFSGKKATYNNVLEMLTEVINGDKETGENSGSNSYSSFAPDIELQTLVHEVM
ncbi:hypothetical protein MettiDRAFT_2630 [Methanolobus tindarius DSM 2278]|uniref:Uncharacterized protein n=1 Tax=Methanolobus tindarius DSM 2278 TaxID=1090322 RepID=W9E0J7_METTI|nr:hypothetical protein [Methanolobus tindarius]ETA69136.1 hypothetical protein MettiDRAFT_2630 [Methanolobus tindarius DSM 2278]